MSIKLRFILAMVALVGLAAVALGWVMVTTTRSSMIENIDNQLDSLVNQIGPDGGFPSARSTNSYQVAAWILLDRDGRVVSTDTAGFLDDPLALPELPDHLPSNGRAHTVPAVDGSLNYRLQAKTGVSSTVVVAMPLTDVEHTVDKLTKTLLITAVALLSLGTLVAWWITRRGLRPVENIIGTAAAIGAGDLRQRIDVPSKRTELGKLASALDEMLARLVTALRQRDADKERLRRFVADASHELRTPLTAITGYTELYRSGGTPPGPRLDRAMERIHGESTRMSTLVEDLLLLARLDQGQNRPRTLVNLRQLAIDATDDARVVTPERTIVLEAPFDVRVLGDEPQLRQVIGNLLRNAQLHTPQDTDILVRVYQDRATAVVMVQDHGPGIPAEHQARIFDRFYRVDQSRSRATGGSGLGLAIVSSVVTAHGGRVHLSSAPGVGTSVYIYLPYPRA